MMREFVKKLLIWTKLLPTLFSPYNLESDRLVVVTGADSSHFKSLCQFLTSLIKHVPDIKVIVFDLGLLIPERH